MTGATIPLVLLGAGGTACEAVDLVAALVQEGAAYRLVAALDDDSGLAGQWIGTVPIAGPLARAREYPSDTRFVDTLGSPRNYSSRPGIVGALGIPEERFVTLVHPAALVSKSVTLGAGSLVFAFAAIGAGARLGSHVTVLPHGTVSHDATVGDWSILATGAIVSGSARIGRCCYLGAGCTVIDGEQVGEGALLGMGSVVIREVPPGVVVAGNPARVLYMRNRPDK
jgi:sugar O-acyltransferase (sialic acid O-acetyltransferase NeuD family)